MKLLFLLNILLCMFLHAPLLADELLVAVSSNFSHAMKDISKRFESETGHRVVLIKGSTGKHYAHIKHGAPFDVFFSADSIIPKILEKEGMAVLGSRFTYAIGELILWSPKDDYVDQKGIVLSQVSSQYLAIANPKLAPYGKAAKEVLQNLNLWSTLKTRLVYGENVEQTVQFVKSGNASMGFIAYSQLKAGQLKGSWWDIPNTLYTPLEQQAVLLKDTKAGRSFLSFFKRNAIQKRIRFYGYKTP